MNRRARVAAIVVALVTGACVALPACAPAAAPGSASSDSPQAIAGVHRHRCGRCHAPPPPQSRTRVHLEEALGRHRSRLHLSDAEWTAIVEYLAAPEGATARQPN